MGENTAIEWCRHTMNFWVGCTALSPACDHCYAEAWAKRTGHPKLWQGDRRRTTAENWHQPLRWDRLAAAAGSRDRVFTNSLADFLDNQVPGRWRDDAWHRIDQCRNLDWMILSKRPENGPRMLPGSVIGAPEWGHGWPNVWMGTTVEDRARKRRIDALRHIPAVIRFLSCEPLLEDLGELDLTGIHLVIVGGESGPSARPMHPAWARAIRDQCAAAGVAFLFKQHGAFRPIGPIHYHDDRTAGAWLTADENRCVMVCEDGRIWPDGPDAPPPGAWMMQRVGKKAAGRLLDGRTWDQMPEVRS